MNNQSVILELREQDTPDGYRVDNGDWETVLNQDVDINDGDSIMIQQTFLDTVAFPEGTITIPNDLTLIIQNYVYNSKWTGGTNGNLPNVYGQFSSAPTDAGSGMEDLSGEPYFLCTKTEGAAMSNYEVAPLCQIRAIGNRSGFNEKYGGYTLTLEYQAVGQTGGQRAYLNLQMPREPNKKGQYYNFLINITFEKNIGLKVSSPSNFFLEKNGSKVSFPGIVAAPAKGNYHPIIFEGNYALPAGNYTPQGLCKQINSQLQLNKGAGPVGGTGTGRDAGGPWNQSQFFVSSDSQCVVEGAINTAATESCTLISMSLGSNKGFQYLASYEATSGAKNIWMGASQVELSYDTDTQKFFWEYLHTPIYAGGGSESVAIQYNSAASPTTANGTATLVYNNGGIIFQSLTAFEGVLNQPSYNAVEFWEGTLKFNLAEVYGPRYTMTEMPDEPFKDSLKPSWNYYPYAQLFYPKEDPGQGVGLTMTGGYIGNDNAIVKDADLSKAYLDGNNAPTYVPFWECVPIPTPAPTGGALVGSFNPIFSTVSATHVVQAAGRMFDTTDIRSHYLIELDAKFRNNFLTNETNIRSMSQVVGKFYSRGSFTQSGGPGFIYTHVGPSLKLSSFKVKILYPDKTLADDIGNDNTVYVAIARNPNSRAIESQELQEFVKDQKAIEQ